MLNMFLLAFFNPFLDGSMLEPKEEKFDLIIWIERNIEEILIYLGVLAGIAFVVWVVVMTKRQKDRETFFTVTYFGFEQEEKIQKGNYITPMYPQKEGYIFCGWYKNTALTEPLESNDLIERDITLYPKWEKER